MPTSSTDYRMRQFTLFSQGESYVDVPPLSRFLHIEMSKEGYPVLVCQVDSKAPRIEWRRVVSVPPGSDLRKYAGWTGIPRRTGDNLWFLDPKIYDHNIKPIDP